MESGGEKIRERQRMSLKQKIHQTMRTSDITTEDGPDRDRWRTIICEKINLLRFWLQKNL